MKHCYWLVKTENPDEDNIIYTNEEYTIGGTVNIDGTEYRIIDKE